MHVVNELKQQAVDVRICLELDLGTPEQKIVWCGGILAHWVHALGLFAHHSTLQTT